jgi:hypothetical protein
VALVRTDVSEELSASIIRVTRIGELGTTLAVTSNRLTLRISAKDISFRFAAQTCEEFKPEVNQFLFFSLFLSLRAALLTA